MRIHHLMTMDGEESLPACPTGIPFSSMAFAGALATSPAYLSSDGDGIYESVDAGESWRSLNAGLTSRYVTQVLCSSNPDDVTTGFVFARLRRGGAFSSVIRSRGDRALAPSDSSRHPVDGNGNRREPCVRGG